MNESQTQTIINIANNNESNNAQEIADKGGKNTAEIRMISNYKRHSINQCNQEIKATNNAENVRFVSNEFLDKE